jgi:hypothetical protein
VLIADIIPGGFKIVKLVGILNLLWIEKIKRRKINAETRLRISQRQFI